MYNYQGRCKNVPSYKFDEKMLRKNQAWGLVIMRTKYIPKSLCKSIYVRKSCMSKHLCEVFTSELPLSPPTLRPLCFLSEVLS